MNPSIVVRTLLGAGPARVWRGGEILAPGNPQAPIQLIDVRDLGEWIVAMAERPATGIGRLTGGR